MAEGEGTREINREQSGMFSYISAGRRRVTLGADKGYDASAFVHHLRDHQVTPLIAQKPASAIGQRTIRHLGYALSQSRCKRVEEAFGWLKTVLCCARRHIAAWPGPVGSSRSPPRLTTWCGSAT